MSHNDIGEINRGKWRKYNPYNPYVPEEEKEKQANNLKVESLDDLFDDDIITDEPAKQPVASTVNTSSTPQDNSNSQGTLNLDDIFGDDDKVISEKNPFEENPEMSAKSMENEKEAPMLPQDDEYDLQKELEAKFDELFGPLDDED